MLIPELYWDDDYDSRATLIQSYQSSDYSDQDDDSADGILPFVKLLHRVQLHVPVYGIYSNDTSTTRFSDENLEKSEGT